MGPILQPSDSFGSNILFDNRIRYQTAVVEVLNDFIPLSGPLLPRAAAFLEYLPWLRIMVAIDDDFESRDSVAQGVGRATRNSGRYYREIILSEHQRNILASNSLLS